MTKQQFLKDINAQVREKCGALDVAGQRAAFLEVLKGPLVDSNALSDFQICAGEVCAKIPAGSKVKPYNVDGYNIPEENAAVIDLICADWLDSDEITKLGKPDSDKAHELLANFFERSLGASFSTTLSSDHGRTAAQWISDNNTTRAISRIRLFYITNRVADVRKLVTQQEEIDGLTYEYVIWDLERLRLLFEGKETPGSINIDFKSDFNGAVPKCIQAQKASGEDAPFDVYIGVIPGLTLANVYGVFGQRLMESNVRAFLQGKGKVNGGIQTTVNEEPSLFVSYNNGVTCTASKVSTSHEKGMITIDEVEDFQIVNGGQTTATLYNTLRKAKSLDGHPIHKVNVQFKLVVTSFDRKEIREKRSAQDKVNDMIKNVSKFSNSQNKIADADFHTNNAYHRNLEKLSRTLSVVGPDSAPRKWYYERARGSYLTDLNKFTKERDRLQFAAEYPKSCQFEKTDVAVVENLWRFTPHTVAKGKQSNFVDLMKYFGNNFPLVDESYYKRLVAKIIVYETVEKIAKDTGLGGNRAAVVAYVTAWIFKRSQRRLNLDKIWDIQRVSDALVDTIKDMIAHANEDLDIEAGNANKMSVYGQARMWKFFKDRDYPVSPAFENELLATALPEFVFERNQLESDWDDVRVKYLESEKTIGEMEIALGKKWVPSHSGRKIREFTQLTWREFNSVPRLTQTYCKQYLEMLKSYLES